MPAFQSCLAHHFTPDGLLASDVCLLSYNTAFTGRWQEDWVVRQGFGCQVKLGKGSFKWMDQEGWISWFQCATLQIMICQSYPESARSTRFAPRCSLPRLPMRWQTLWLHWNGAGLGSGQCSKFREMEHQEGTFKLHLFSSCILYEMKCFSLHIHSVQRNYSQTSQGLCWFGQ